MKTSEGYAGAFPPEGKDIFNQVVVNAKQTDGNLENNSATASTRVLPSSNRPPTVSLTAPVAGNPLAAPAQITVSAVATDPDGSISKVLFFDKAVLVAEVTGNGGSQFTTVHNNVGPGAHDYTALARDNLGRWSVSESVTVFVNGPASITLTSPVAGFSTSPGSNIQLGAQATHPSGTITEVEFFANGRHIGHGVAVSGGSYTFNWEDVPSNVYSIYAVATDTAGVQSRSVARTITVNTAPTVAVVTPFEGQRFNSSPNIGLTAVADDSDGQIAKVDFYVNNTLIGTATDIRGGTVQVELAQSVSQAGWVENMLKIEKDTNNYYLIDTGAGNTLFRSMVNGVNDQSFIPFDPVAHRYWRVRHDLSSNVVSFETSADAITWTTRKTATAGFALTAVRFSLIAGAWGTGNAAPGAAVYNDFQFIPDPSLPGTPAPILSDDFNDNSVDTSKWIPDNLFSGYTNLDVPLNETGQRLEIGPLLQDINGSSYRGIRSLNAYNFTGAYSYVELVQAPSAATSADAMFTAGKDVNYYYRVYVNSGNLIGQRKIDGIKTTLFTIPYDPINHRFLRIRHSATGSVTLDTAPNEGGAPGTWVQRYSEIWNASISLTEILLEVKGGTWQIEANPPGKVIFDNFILGVQ